MTLGVRQHTLPSQPLPGRASIWRLAAAVFFGAPVALAACAAPAAPPAPVLPTPERVREVTVTIAASVTVADPAADARSGIRAVISLPQTLQIRPWRRVTLRAAAYDGRGTPAQGVRFEWSGINPAAGLVDTRPDDTNTFLFRASGLSGNYPGALIVTAVQDTPQGTRIISAPVDVYIVPDAPPKILASVEFVASEIVASQGQLVQLRAIGFDSFGRIVHRTRFEWELASPEIGVVNRLGYLTVNASPGRYENAVIVKGYGADDSTGEAAITLNVVAEPNLQREPDIYVYPRSATIPPSSEFHFFAGLVAADGRTVRAKNASWTLRDPDIGVIDSQGVFTPSPGSEGRSSVITFETVHDGPHGPVRQIALAQIRIRRHEPPSPLDQLEIIPYRLVARPGQHSTIRVLALDKSENLASGIQIEWRVAPEAGGLDELGFFVATGAPGVYPNAIRSIVRQEAGDRVVTKEAAADVLIAGEIAAVEISPASVLLQTGRAFRFSAVAFDALGIAVPDIIFEWSVEDPAAGSIDIFGNFLASDAPGSYRDAVTVTAVQSIVETGPLRAPY